MNLEDSQQESHTSLIGNYVEAKFVAGLAKHIKRELERQGEGHRSLGILTFYNRQRRLIFDELRKLRVPTVKNTTKGYIIQYLPFYKEVLLNFFCTVFPT